MLKHEKINHTEHECKTCKLLFKNAVDLNAHITQEHVLNETLRHTRSRNKRKLVHKDEQNQNSKKRIKVQPKTDSIKDVNIKKRKQINHLMEETNKKIKLEPTTYTKSDRKRKREEDLSMGNEDNRRIKHTMTCSICGKEFESLFEYQDHRH